MRVAIVSVGHKMPAWIQAGYGEYVKRLPPEIVARVNQAVNAALAEPELKERFARLGAETTGGTPQAFAAVVKAESAKWKKVITERKITAD